MTVAPAIPSLTSDVLASNSPIRDLLRFSDRIGAIFRLDGFTEAAIITNDKFVRDAHGVPLHAFLLAAPGDVADPAQAASTRPDDEEVILLRVTGNVSLPQENDLQFLRAEVGMDLVVEPGRETPRTREQMIDALTEDRMQTAGLRCAILGTFYDQDLTWGPQLAFGSDIDNVYASCRLQVFKPYGDSLHRIVSFMAEQRGDEPRRTFHLGDVRYASTRRRERLAAEHDKPVDVPVEVDIADFIAHKTAVLGMTRKGKSNTNKVIAATVFQYAREHRLNIGQLIFDPAGEYANRNEQDKTALAEIGADHVIRYRLGAREEELAEDEGLRSLALNFFDEREVGVVWSLVGAYLRRVSNAQYAQSFAAADIIGPGNPQDSNDYRLVSYARRARMMVYASFLKAGLNPPAGWEMWVPLKQAVRDALVHLGGRRGEDLSFLNTVGRNKRGDVVVLNGQQLQLICEAIGANYFSGTPHAEISDWVDVPDERVKNVMGVLMERSGGGYKLLLGLREGYHSPHAGEDYAPRVMADLVAGRIVIIDLARGGEGVLQFASERILNYLLHQAAERFRSGLPPHRIQIFLEEAQRLFDRERFKNLDEADPYVRLAREAGKYKIGMVYSTQQVSSVEPDVLDNTANWIVAHLNSEQEVKLLRGRYEFDRFADQIRHAEDVGFVRVKTQSSRFVIPMQVRLFDQHMVEAARLAQPRTEVE